MKPILPAATSLPGHVPNTAVASNLGPELALPMRFVLTGIVMLFIGMAMLLWRPEILAAYHYTQYAVAVTHLIVLGGITTLIMGAMYQMVPVALEARLYSERLGYWQYFMHVLGVVGMIWFFWIWDMKQVGHAGSLVGLGMGLFIYNLSRTLSRMPRWNVIATAIAWSLFWLGLTLLAGLYLTADKCWNFNKFYVMAQIHAHAHLGVVGFFVLLMIGVSFKLVPMFVLSELQSPRRAALSVILLNVGLAITFLTILFQSPWRLAGAGLLAAALGVYGWEINAILRARKRRKLDWALRYFITALAGLAPVTLLGVILCWPGLPVTLLTTQLENVYGFLGIWGVLIFAILGMSYKIVPFLVWYRSYSSHIGRGQVPALGDMYSSFLQRAGYWTYLAGLVAVSVAMALGHETATRLSLVILALSLILYAINLGKILTHLWKPQIQPLLLHPTPQPV